MPRSLALIFLFLTVCTCAHAQKPVRLDHIDAQIIDDATADQVVAARAIMFLKKLDDETIVYRSLGEFEQSGELARVPFEDFQRDLSEVTPQVQQLLSSLPNGRVKTDLSNALASYRDGAYWWQKIYQARVVRVSDLSPTSTGFTAADSFFAANIPYTVAIHWRQANKHLQRAVRSAGL